MAVKSSRTRGSQTGRKITYPQPARAGALEPIAGFDQTAMGLCAEHGLVMLIPVICVGPRYMCVECAQNRPMDADTVQHTPAYTLDNPPF